METKELPSEYVSIRQVWLMQINRCSENFSNRYKNDISITGDYRDTAAGCHMVYESVDTLFRLLVDFGEAHVKSDVRTWRKNVMFAAKDYKSHKLSWYVEYFEFIIEVLNRYGLLFDSQPQGYSNVTMEEVHDK